MIDLIHFIELFNMTQKSVFTVNQPEPDLYTHFTNSTSNLDEHTRHKSLNVWKLTIGFAEDTHSKNQFGSTTILHELNNHFG